MPKPKLIAQMIVRNEASRYLQQCLENLLEFCDKIVIVDDASTDNTVGVCKFFGKKIKIKRLRKNLFGTNEAKLRAILWEMVREEKPEWVLSVDADEIFDNSMKKQVKKLMDLDINWIAFRLCDMWDKNYYRIDGFWSPIFIRMFRFKDLSFNRRGSIHCGSNPEYVSEEKNGTCKANIRIKHLGWIKEEDKKRRSEFYLKKTKEDDKTVNRKHAENIFETPTLKKWKNKISLPKILITSLVRNRELCLGDFLKGIENLDYPKSKISFFFILNDSMDKSEKILDDFALKNRKKYRKIEIKTVEFDTDPKDHSWDDKKLMAMTLMRNASLENIRDNDYILSIDSDLIIKHKEILKHLVCLEREVISEVFWAKWGSLDNEPLPNVWLRGEYEISRPFLLALKRRWIYRVGGLGAFTLISKLAIDKGVCYDKISNLPKDMRGEDRHFCIRCETLGIPLWADTFFPLQHFEKDLIDLKRYLKEYKKKNRNTISLVTMVKDEEEILENFLEMFSSLFDEVILVDTGSTDRTIKIGKALGAKVFKYPLDNNFSKARNFGLRKATSKWIMQLDPDEIIQIKDLGKIFEMVKEKKVTAYLFRVFNYQLDGKPSLSESYRLFRNQKDLYYYGFCHETIENSLSAIPKLAIQMAPIIIHHRGYLRGNLFVEKKLRLYEKLNKLWIDVNPVDAKPYFNLGIQYLNDGKIKMGIDYLKRATRLDPHFYRPRQELGFEYIRLGNKYLEEVMTLLPQGHPFQEYLKNLTKDLNRKVEARTLVGKAALLGEKKNA